MSQRIDLGLDTTIRRLCTLRKLNFYNALLQRNPRQCSKPPVLVLFHVSAATRVREAHGKRSKGAVRGSWLEPGRGLAKRADMSEPTACRYFKTCQEIICLAVMLYIRLPLSLRNAEDLLHQRGVDVSHETVRFWWHGFGPKLASEIRKRRIEGIQSSRWRWHLVEMFVKNIGKRHYLWRAEGHEGEVLEGFVTKTRDKKAALKFLKKAMRKHDRPLVIVTDKLRSYDTALTEWRGLCAE